MLIEAPQTTDPLEQIPVREVDPLQDEKLRILRKAREILARPWGWCKHSFVTKGRKPQTGYFSYCALGAITLAEGGSVSPGPSTRSGRKAADDLARTLGWKNRRGSGDALTYVMRFNDADETRKCDVIDALDRTILRIEEG
jgi:hypothetical protein